MERTERKGKFHVCFPIFQETWKVNYKFEFRLHVVGKSFHYKRPKSVLADPTILHPSLLADVLLARHGRWRGVRDKPKERLPRG